MNEFELIKIKNIAYLKDCKELNELNSDLKDQIIQLKSELIDIKENFKSKHEELKNVIIFDFLK